MAKKLLTDVTIRNTKPTEKELRLNDGSGLYLLVKKNGAKWWRFDYTFNKKRKTLWRFLVSQIQIQHIVQLFRQVIAKLNDIAPLTGHGRYVFPSE